MLMDNNKTDAFHLFGKASSPTQEGVTKKSSNALATTLSTCQVPGKAFEIYFFGGTL